MAEALRIVVPERRTREVIIKAPGAGEDLAQRSSIQVVDAANRAIGGSSVVAARRLPSGDIILSFEGKADESTKETAWVQTAFGSSAQVRPREFTVIAKGLPAQRLRAIHDPQCHKFGHIARYCNNQARCGCCSGVAHDGGEANCPENGEGGRKKCVNCSRDQRLIVYFLDSSKIKTPRPKAPGKKK
jgi:hypothetical protein